MFLTTGLGYYDNESCLHGGEIKMADFVVIVLAVEMAKEPVLSVHIKVVRSGAM